MVILIIEGTFDKWLLWKGALCRKKLFSDVLSGGRCGQGVAIERWLLGQVSLQL